LLSLPLSVPKTVSHMRLPSTAFRSLNHPSAPLDQMPNPTRGARSDDEHFILCSKFSQASIVKEDKKLLIDLREVISPYMMKLGFAVVPTVGFEQRREKIMKAATMSYVGERLDSEKEVNTSKPQRSYTTSSSTATDSTSTTSLVKSMIPLVQYSDINGTLVETLGLNVDVHSFNFSDDAMTKSCNPWLQVQDHVGDVNNDIWFGPAARKSLLHDVHSYIRHPTVQTCIQDKTGLLTTTCDSWMILPMPISEHIDL